MQDYKKMALPSGLCLLPVSEFISLLEFKLDSLKKAREEDSSWNYGIEELEADIEYLKTI